MLKDKYDAWEKYDLDKNLEEVDERTKEEERDRLHSKLSEKQASLETGAIGSELMKGEALDSQAAAGNLKAVRKGRKARSAKPAPVDPAEQGSAPTPSTAAAAPAVSAAPDPSPSPSAAAPSSPAPAPAPAQTPPPTTKAEQAKSRAASLKSACEFRESGKAHAKAGKFARALSDFEEGERHLDAYEDLLEPPPVPEGAENDENAKPTRSSRDMCCGPNAGELKRQQQQLKPDPLQPDKDNLGVTLRRDFNLNSGRALLSLGKYGARTRAERARERSGHASGAGTRAERARERSEHKEGATSRAKQARKSSEDEDAPPLTPPPPLLWCRYAEASESLKNVLLVDGGNVSAWVARAECYRKMGLLTLADLHLVKATEIDDVDKNAKAVRAMNDKDLIVQKAQQILGGVDGGDEDPVKVEINSRKSAKELLEIAMAM
jgi:tetratricopeptide (TPR) repeat protein